LDSLTEDDWILGSKLNDKRPILCIVQEKEREEGKKKKRRSRTFTVLVFDVAGKRAFDKVIGCDHRRVTHIDTPSTTENSIGKPRRRE